MKEKLRQEFLEKFTYPHKPFAPEGTDAPEREYFFTSNYTPDEIIDWWVENMKNQHTQIINKMLDLPATFWEDDDHTVGGYISKRDLKRLLLEMRIENYD